MSLLSVAAKIKPSGTLRQPSKFTGSLNGSQPNFCRNSIFLVANRVPVESERPTSRSRRSRQQASLVEFDEAFERLYSVDPRQAQIVEMRYFAGLKIEETAEVLDLSPSTVKREWQMARAWLKRELSD